MAHARIKKHFKLLEETNRRIELLAEKLNTSQAEIVRRAIGQLYRTVIPDDPRENRLNHHSIRAMIEPILEFAWGGRLLNVSPKRYGQILADLFPEAYDDQVDVAAMDRKARIDAAKLGMVEAARDGGEDATVGS